MSEHCSDRELEILCFSPDSLEGDEKEKIMLHLEGCLLCKEHHEKLKQYYQSLEETLNSPPTERDSTFAHRLLSRSRLSLPGRRPELSEKSDSLMETFAEVIEPYRRSLVRRVIRYFRVHPVRSAGMVSFAAIALVLAFISIRPKVDKDPAIGEGKDGFLIVSNKHGDELWRKYIGASFVTPDYPHPERVISLQDVDGDGRDEVLCIFGWTAANFPFNNLLACYNPDGAERWKYEIHRNMTIGGIAYSDQYRFYHIEAGDFAHSGKIEIIVAARHDPWSPNVLIRLNGESGKLLSEFWHPGQLREFDHKDLDHDGVEELIYGGQNSRLQHACVVVFDPRKVSGFAPASEGYYPKGSPAGTEKYYITLPASDLKEYASDVTNEVVGLRITNDGMIEVIVNEPVRTMSGTLYYYFDSSLHCTDVRTSDSFTAAHQKLERDGKLSSHIDAKYLEALRRGVMYWDGDKFVDRVTVNKHYIDAMKPPPLP